MIKEDDDECMPLETIQDSILIIPSPSLQESVKRQGSADFNEASPLTNLQSAYLVEEAGGYLSFPRSPP